MDWGRKPGWTHQSPKEILLGTGGHSNGPILEFDRVVVDSKEAVNRDWRVLELNVLTEVLPLCFFKVRKSDVYEVANVDN